MASLHLAASILTLCAVSVAVRMDRLKSDFESEPSLVESAGGLPKLCDPELVKAACRSLDLDNSAGYKMASVYEVSSVMSATRPSTVAFLRAIGISVSDVHGVDLEVGGEDIECEELCSKVVDSISPDRLPTTSDVGCRIEGGGSSTCDIGLSPRALESVEFPQRVLGHDHGHDHGPDQGHDHGHDHGHGHGHDHGHDHGIQEEEEEEALSITGHAVHNEECVTVSLEDAKTKIANLFRIYPLLHITVDGDADGGAAGGSLAEEAAEEEAAEDQEEGANRCFSFCQYFPWDCKGRNQRYCGDCPQCSSGAGTWPLRPTRPTTPTARPAQAKPQWMVDVEKVSIKAQGYVARAIQLAPRDSTELQRWFGPARHNEERARARVMEVLNSLSGMLSNVAYKFGPECSSNTYAYVYPRGPQSKNAQGQFVFFLCEVYFRSDEGEKIETLMHEGSHHATAFTDDVCAGGLGLHGKCLGGRAYGRPVCQEVARRYPERALNNADNFCYYINDLNGDTRR